jgi:hypothetical protein
VGANSSHTGKIKMDRIEKDFSEIDADKVDFQNSEWTFGRGGHPLKDHEWSISHIDEDLNETRYKLPACINKMLHRQYQWGKDKALRNVRNALGL